MAQPRTHSQRSRQDSALAGALLLPSALVLGAFWIAPLLYAFWLSLHDWRLAPGPFVGLQNYTQALIHAPETHEFRQALTVTLWYVLGTVPATLILGYLLAELLHSRLRGLAVYRTLFFIPYVVSPVAVAAVWRWILNPNFGVASATAAKLGLQPRWLDEPAGVFALLGDAVHLPLPEWAAGPSLALVCIMAVAVWQTLGFAIVVYLAGMATVPAEVVEAARLDGASGWRLVRCVKLPLLSPTLFFLLIVLAIRAFQTFTQIYIMTVDDPGGPAGTTRNITLYIVQSFYDNAPRLGPGYGSAVAVLLFAMLLCLTLVQFRVLGRRVHY